MTNTPEIVDRAEQVPLSVDLLLLPHGFVTELPARDVYRDEWVCLVSADRSAAGGLTVEELATRPWVVTFHGPMVHPTAYTNGDYPDGGAELHQAAGMLIAQL